MKNASELRKIALEKQECDYSYNYNKVICQIDEIIENRANEGYTWLYLVRCDVFYCFTDHTFGDIDRKMFKMMKSYYKKKGFKISKSIFNGNIYIEW